MQAFSLVPIPSSDSVHQDVPQRDAVTHQDPPVAVPTLSPVPISSTVSAHQVVPEADAVPVAHQDVLQAEAGHVAEQALSAIPASSPDPTPSSDSVIKELP